MPFYKLDAKLQDRLHLVPDSCAACFTSVSGRTVKLLQAHGLHARKQSFPDGFF